MDDSISRQAAIDALRYAQHRFTVSDEAGGMGTVKWSENVIYSAAAERVLTELPSAQPEPIKINIEDFNKEDWERLKKEWGNMPITVLPSAQPEIIRCKDCKWYGRADKRRFYRGMDCLQKRIDTIVPDKDFCSRAERRTDE